MLLHLKNKRRETDWLTISQIAIEDSVGPVGNLLVQQSPCCSGQITQEGLRRTQDYWCRMVQ